MIISDLKNQLTKIKDTVKNNIPFEIQSTGKFIRSNIGLLFLKALDIELEEKYINFLSAIELIHNASLLHDDVIDNETQRRGEPAVNVICGNKTAILYGNLILTNAIDLILKLESDKILKLINKTIKDMCNGELIQIAQNNKLPAIEEYIEKTYLKTAVLFECMLEGITVLSKKEIQITEFGKNYGIAFQIKNDLDDYKKGINNSSDIKNKIYTAPTIYAADIKYHPEAIEKTAGLIDNYSKRAINALSGIRESEYKNLLRGVVECLAE